MCVQLSIDFFFTVVIVRFVSRLCFSTGSYTCVRLLAFVGSSILHAFKYFVLKLSIHISYFSRSIGRIVATKLHREHGEFNGKVFMFTFQV